MGIRDSYAIAQERGRHFSFAPNEVETDIHPNTVDIRMENADGLVMTVRGESWRQGAHRAHQRYAGGVQRGV